MSGERPGCPDASPGTICGACRVARYRQSTTSSAALLSQAAPGCMPTSRSWVTAPGSEPDPAQRPAAPLPSGTLPARDTHCPASQGCRLDEEMTAQRPLCVWPLSLGRASVRPHEVTCDCVCARCHAGVPCALPQFMTCPPLMASGGIRFGAIGNNAPYLPGKDSRVTGCASSHQQCCHTVPIGACGHLAHQQRGRGLRAPRPQRRAMLVPIPEAVCGPCRASPLRFPDDTCCFGYDVSHRPPGQPLRGWTVPVSCLFLFSCGQPLLASRSSL